MYYCITVREMTHFHLENNSSILFFVIINPTVNSYSNVPCTKNAKKKLFCAVELMYICSEDLSFSQNLDEQTSVRIMLFFLT